MLDCWLMGSKRLSHNSDRVYQEALDRLQESGLKLTKNRKQVLSFLTQAHGPFSIEEIHQGIQEKSCNITTIYRILSHFLDIELARKTDLGDQVARYEYLNPHHGHHHLICSECKRVEIVEEQEIPSMHKIALKKGFAKVNPYLEIFGTCKNCI